MKLYAELPARRTRQIVADVSAVAWTALWVQIAYLLHQAISALAKIPDQVTRDGNSLRDSLNGAAKEAGKIPLVGKELGQKLADAAGVAQSAAEAGRTGSETVGTVALFTAIVVGVAVTVPILLFWILARARWVARARTAVLLRDEPAGEDLLALRALSTAALKRLRQAAADPAGGWRDRDPVTMKALATLELATLGLRSR
ncbi:hypothetical protein Lfu02_67130 [Longispora fulva]|uniref:Transmembrane protein n=1 Tax=Longispora fulva TaxID=619741 RepID=A0A8J7GU84_9ACTN|nr:hypothetical protein [Longispora fulva]MBG6138554.1 hypothetical protein [Longispora fulva]GIG62341.1 hypothetical protein Lfu02_67130 [Longispora fulva]